MKQITTKLTGELRAAHYEKTGKTWLTVRTGSMEPLIRPGEQVLISAVIAGDISPGEIIVFRRNESLIGHRVLKKQYTGNGVRFIEKGDNSDIYGAFIESDVIGRVIVVKGRKKLLALDTFLGRFAGKTLLIWFSCTSLIHKRLSTSRCKTVIRLDSGLTHLIRIISAILVKMCYLVLQIRGSSHKI